MEGQSQNGLSPRARILGPGTNAESKGSNLTRCGAIVIIIPGFAQQNKGVTEIRLYLFYEEREIRSGK